MSEKIFFEATEFEKAEYNHKWRRDDTRRVIFRVVFSNGFVWYPKDEEIQLLKEARAICFNHNIQFPNLDEEDEL
jgi:hypothetical protein